MHLLSSRNAKVWLVDLSNLCENSIGIEILEGVEDAHGLAGGGLTLHGDLRICTPLIDFGLWDLGRKHALSEGIGFSRSTEPVDTLGHGLKGGSRCVYTIVTSVGLALKSELLVVVQDRAANRSDRGRARISGTEDDAAEISPGQCVGGPADSVPLDLFTGGTIRRAHGHVKSVHDVNAINLATVEASAELDEVLTTAKLGPFGIQTGTIDTKLGGSILGIVDLTGGDGVLPLLAKHLLELGLALVGNVQLRGAKLDGLAGNGTVMGVDVHVLVDYLRRHLSLGGYADAILGKRLLNDSLDGARLSLASVGLQSICGRTHFFAEEEKNEESVRYRSQRECETP